MSATDARPRGPVDAPGPDHPAAAPQRPAVPLVVGIDDVGLDPAIDRAALALAAAGRASALSLQVGGPTAAAVAPALTRLDRSRVDVGLHLDLTEHPLGLAPQPLPRLLRQALAGATDAAALRAEVQRQLERFEALIGHPPDHVDGHQHVHQFPGVREALLGTLQAQKLTPWLRATHAPAGAGPKAWLIASLGAAGLRRRAEALGLAHNRRLLGVHGLRDDAPAYQRRLARWLAMARAGDLLMTHPADAPTGTDALSADRQAEFEVLASPWFGTELARHGLVVAPLRQALAAVPGGGGC